MRSLEQVYGKIKDQPVTKLPKADRLPPLRLPDTAKTLIVTVFGTNRFVGQATYWKRGTRWTCIGCLRTIDWLLDIPFSLIPEALAKRGLAFKWKDASPFVQSQSPRPEVTGSVH